jgi:ribonuclease-3
MEAVMGAVWLDGGLSAAQTVFDHLALPLNAPLNEWAQNPKGALQVKAQSLQPPRLPVYTIDSVKGPAHAPIVTVTVTVEGWGAATATAGSKTAAETAAATKLLENAKV